VGACAWHYGIVYPAQTQWPADQQEQIFCKKQSQRGNALILDRYISRAIIAGTMMSLFVFGSLFAFISFVSELQHAGVNNYGALQALIYVLLNLPQLLYQVFPSAMLLGGLLSLGALASSSELIVMRAAGISIFRITVSVLRAGVLLIVIVVLLGEFLAPVSISTAKTMRAEAIEGRVLTGDRKGLWSKYADNFVYIGTVLPDVQLRDVIVYELDDQHRLKKTTFAGQAHYEDGSWHLQDVTSSVIDEKTVSSTYNADETWPVMVSIDLFNVLNLEPEDMSATELWQYSSYLDDNELDSGSFWLAFWIKVFTPLTSAGMLMISVPLVLTSSSRSGGAGQRILIGVMIGVAFYVLNRVINQMGIIYGITPVLSAGLPSIMVIAAAVLLIRKIR
jgi:lipopolysaccharide export system permease protein